MAVYKDSKGKWYVNTSYYENGKRKYITKRGFDLKRDAQEWEALNKNLPEVKYKSMTYNQLLHEFVSHKQANDETKKTTISLHKKYMSDFINKQYSSLTKPSVNKWLLSINNLSVSTTQKNKIISSFKGMCKYGANIYDLYDYGKGLKAFKHKIGEKKESSVWSIDEFNSFISCVDNQIMAALFTFLFFTGCRRGEALALHKEDIKDNIVNISKSIKHAKNGLKTVKNDSSIRSIELNKRTLDIIKSLYEYDGEFLFGGIAPIGLSTIQRYFDKGIKDSGVKPIRIHDLRHSHATILINEGINIVAVSKRLGHSDINITLKTYTHLLEKNSKRLIDFLDNL